MNASKTKHWLLPLITVSIIFSCWQSSTSAAKGANQRKNQARLQGFTKKQIDSGEAKKTTVHTKSISAKWYGTYEFTMNAEAQDWREQQAITLIIKKDSIIYKAEGHQIYQQYALSAKELGNALRLTFLKALDHTRSAVLDKTKDFGTFSRVNHKYTWIAPYLYESFGGAAKKTYVLKKK
jgi:hypothetical protein